jgi:hypothetical protein
MKKARLGGKNKTGRYPFDHAPAASRRSLPLRSCAGCFAVELARFCFVADKNKPKECPKGKLRSSPRLRASNSGLLRTSVFIFGAFINEWR